MKKYLELKQQVAAYRDVSATIKVVEKKAASNIHLLKQKVTNLRLYRQQVIELLARLTPEVDLAQYRLLRPQSGPRLLVVIGGDKGIVGSLYHDLTNLLLNKQQEYTACIAIGKKTALYLKEEGIQLVNTYTGWSQLPTIAEVAVLQEELINRYRRREFGSVALIYPRFLTLAEQQATITPFLPFAYDTDRADPSEMPPGLPLYFPSLRRFFDNLLEKQLATFLYEIVYEAKLSEFAARTVTAEHASVETESLIRKLIVQTTKERQRHITQKQLESYFAHRAL